MNERIRAMRFPGVLLLGLGLGTSLAAQMPPGWNRLLPLGSGEPEGAAWYGFGLWSADKHGPPATLVDAAGLGNALTGSGFHLEAGTRLGNWNLAAEWLGVREPAGGQHLTLYRGHATWRSRPDDGWLAGLELEPLVWGYGLNGGYLLGEAARPFPKLRVESPMAPLTIFRIPLGTWGWQAFMGRLENHREISASSQEPLHLEALRRLDGEPEAPFLNGYRVQAEFSDFMEFYANYINLWGGTLNGRSMLAGYGVGDYFTSAFGLKDTLAEANLDQATSPAGGGAYVNRGRSASNADVGFRVRSRPLERWLGAESVYGYVSRGSKSVFSNPGRFLGNPPRYFWKDAATEWKRATQARLPAIWNATSRYTSPNLSNPNDAIGVLLAWPRIRLGLEYLDAVNATGAGNATRPFSHGIYLAGFYTQGDPLGNAIGGEARTTTVRLEADFNDRWSGTTVFHLGESPFRDDLALWQAAYPGLQPVTDRFVGLQQSLCWRIRPGTTLAAAASWERHGAAGYVPDATRNGFQWNSDLSFRWPRPVR